MSPSQTFKNNKQTSYMSMTLISLRYKDFRLVWLGSVTEHIGEFMEIAAVLWLVNELTHSPFMLTIVGTARYVPMIFFPIMGGVVADRINRRGLLIIALAASGFLSLCLAFLTFTGLIAIWHLIVIGLLSGVVISFNHPARQTIVPNLIKKEHLLNAVSLDFISIQGARMVGMALAGYLILMLGMWPIFVFRALGCMFAILWLCLAKVPSTPVATREKSPYQNMMDGFHYLHSNTIILGLVILYLIPWLTSNTVVNFLPVFAGDILNIGAVGYGYLQAAPGVGAIISLITLTFFTYYKKKWKLLVVTGIMMGLSLSGFSASIWVPLSIPLLVVVGAVQTAFSTVNTTIIQAAVPDELRGRIMSWREVAFGLGPTGSIIFGAVAQVTGVQISLGLLGLITIISTVWLFIFFPRIREIPTG